MSRSDRDVRAPVTGVDIFGIVALLVVLAGSYALCARFVIHGPVNDRSLTISVNESGGSGWRGPRADCERDLASSDWTCSMTERVGSGGVVEYRVVLRPSSSCWDARRLSMDEQSPASFSGCVHRWQWSYGDLSDLLT